MNKKMFFFLRLLLGLQLTLLGIMTIINGQSSDMAAFFNSDSEISIILLGICQLLCGISVIALLYIKNLPAYVWYVVIALWAIIFFVSNIFSVNFSRFEVYEWLNWLYNLVINATYTIVLLTFYPKKNKS